MSRGTDGSAFLVPNWHHRARGDLHQLGVMLVRSRITGLSGTGWLTLEGAACRSGHRNGAEQSIPQDETEGGWFKES